MILKTTDDDVERDDLTISEKWANLILFFIFAVVLLIYIIQLKRVLEKKNNNFVFMHYSIIGLIFVSIISR